ncbi:MAG: undecaprenyl-diphosphate phosphatase [Candidatus Cloacimonetes bacterium]|nr:undecaprenyl-diphosphate phosphatase [Candidatus Cloacimonadota bacterium]
MEIIKSIILGIIQGLTEFLPISSSGHLVLAKHYLNFEMTDITFEIFLHLGSVIAVLLYFRKDILNLLKSLFIYSKDEVTHSNNRKIIFYLFVATVITALIGYYFEETIQKVFTSLYIPSIMLSITGIILIISDKIESKGLGSYQLGIKKSILIGLGQAFAILPGISRSGTTIALGIFTGLKREEAARFSFLLSVPIILGANVHKMSELSNLPKTMLLPYLFGLIAAFFSGYMVISLLISFVKKQKLKYFAYYCWLVSIVTLILYLTQ